jgi:exopolysaccharide production protein ExoQ
MSGKSITSSIPITQPIRIAFDRKSRSYKLAVLLAYPGLFAVMAGDSIRYSIGWLGWGALIGVGIIATIVAMAIRRPVKTFTRIPEPLILLLILMVLSTIWSQYRPMTLLAVGLQLGTTLFALFLVSHFGWRQLLHILANTVRFILVLSLIHI